MFTPVLHCLFQPLRGLQKDTADWIIHVEFHLKEMSVLWNIPFYRKYTELKMAERRVEDEF